MVKKYIFGKPFATDAVVEDIPAERGSISCGSISTEEGFTFTYCMGENDIVYGLGEANRGINKRGWCYVSYCTDDPYHTEDKHSFYGAHNFIVLSGKETRGLFFDYPSRMTFDVGYSEPDELTVSCARADLYLYVIEGESAYDIVRQFRRIIGKSYIPPKFAFGYGQSRWGYRTKEDYLAVADGYRNHHIPLDMIYMDIDYMEGFKDFTINEDNFPDFSGFVQQMKDKGIRLIPIIDAGVKIEKGYPVYEEGVKQGYFCKQEDGSDYVAEVWPGDTHLPDVLNPEARKWFGDHYRFLVQQGIEGFWNDMNEPAMFHCDPGEEYKKFYHNVEGKKICHDMVHNLYGYNMTRSAGEALERIEPEKRFLLFSRASYIGMHRYGGIWTGDNHSWWSHLLLNLKMLPSLNMCGFLYIGADLGGFGGDTTRDLLLRWLALGVFTPLMRNHTALGTRDQEAYQFGDTGDFRGIIETRYRLLPYLYHVYRNAAEDNDMFFKPLAFVYPEDDFAREVEDQLMVGDEIMIAPVYTQNARGRYVYLPERMMFVKFWKDGQHSEEILEKGHHYVEVALHEVPLFIREGKCIPVVPAAQCVDEIDETEQEMLGFIC